MKRTDRDSPRTIAECMGLTESDLSIKKKVAADVKGADAMDKILKVYAHMSPNEAVTYAFYLGTYFALFTDNCKEMRAAAVLMDVTVDSKMMEGRDDAATH